MESRFFNNLLHYISQDERFNREMTAAKKEFEQIAGPIHDADREYLARINSFHNWYILDRPLTAHGLTPLEYFLQYNANSLSPEELTGYRDLCTNIHSVFELAKRTKTHTWVRDLISRRKFIVEGGEDTDHIDPGALFNSRLFFHGGKTYFTNYVVPHPEIVAKDIKRAAKRCRKAKRDPKGLLFQLVLFHSRWDQYRQFDAKNIYRFEN
ncbi:MAG: hypothetical protein O7A67_09615 [SAR324 cluster bacterium]|nr:hypothetical protein [SAR324 cluster bacterium]